MLLVVATVVAAVPDTRHAVARWLGFESLRIEVVERIPPDLVPDTAPPADLIIETLPGRLDDGLYVKLVDSGVQITQVDVAGRLGYWITGEPHVLMYRDADGDVREARIGRRHPRVAGRRRHPAHRGRHLPRPSARDRHRPRVTRNTRE